MSNTEKIAALRKEAEELEAADSAFNALPEEHKLAISLHELMCRWNHADGCSWFYEIVNKQDDWNGFAHGEYLTKARLTLTFCKKHNIQSSDAVQLIQLINK